MEEEVRRSLWVRLDGMAVRHPDGSTEWAVGVYIWGSRERFQAKDTHLGELCL